MTAALSEWLNVTELSWIHFKLHWIKASDFKCDCLHREPTRQWNFGITLAPLLREFFLKSNLTHVKSHSSAKASVTMSLTVGIRVHNAFLVCVHVCAYTSYVYVFHWGLFLRVKSCQISSQIWASEFDTKCAFCFCKKSKFCCKMHMQKFCTEVTILPQVELLPVLLAWKSWERDLKFVEIVWGFTIMSLFNPPATLAGD